MEVCLKSTASRHRTEFNLLLNPVRNYRQPDFFIPSTFALRQPGRDVTGDFRISGSEREFTLGGWYADEEIQAGAGRYAAAAD